VVDPTAVSARRGSPLFGVVPDQPQTAGRWGSTLSATPRWSPPPTGGSTWSTDTLPSSAQDVTSISCPTTSDCLALGFEVDGFDVFATTDGGSTWTAESLPSGASDLNSISCPTNSDCWAAGTSLTGPSVYATTDGGSTWSSESLPVGSYSLAYISCPTATNCWATGTEGDFTSGVCDRHRRRRNGPGATRPFRPGPGRRRHLVSHGHELLGHQWRAKPRPAPMIANPRRGEFLEPPEPSGRDFDLNSISCATASNCWAMGEDGSLAGAIVATSDGGSTWNAETFPAGTALLEAILVCNQHETV